MLDSLPDAQPALRRPASFIVAALGVATAVIGLALWIVEVIDDVVRLDTEADTLGAGSPLSYTVASIALMAILFLLVLLDIVAMSWLWIQGERASLTVTILVLGVTGVCCGLPSSVAALLLGNTQAWSGSSTGLDYDSALSLLHNASTPQWVKVAAAVGSGLITLGSFAGAIALLRSSSRRFVRDRGYSHPAR